MTRMKCAGMTGIIVLLLSLPVHLQGQEGYNAVSSDKNGTATASPAFIDATPFFTGDICSAINTILTSTGYGNFPNGAVIDARGILVNASGGPPPLTCGSNPFAGVTKPSTVLLPGESIAITTTWQLPSNTRIIGEGPTATQLEVSTSGLIAGTTTMMEMCPGSVVCTGISIEHLRIVAQDGSGVNYAVDGIDNKRAGDGSYVDDVVLANIGATVSVPSITNDCHTSNSPKGSVVGLCVSPTASHSGPYTNIDLAASTDCSGGTCVNTSCAKIQAQIRGLRGLTCTAKSSSSAWPAAAIYLDSYNVSVEDVHIEGYKDGIVIGDNSDSEGGKSTGDVIANVTSVFGRGPVQNTVHICNPSNVVSPCTSTSLSVSDLTLMNVMSQGFNTNVVPDTIEDDLFSQTLNSSIPAVYVGLYAIGEKITTGVYPRFTTSGGPNTTTGSTAVTPTWGVGSSAPVSGTACSNNGAIFSNTGNTTGSKQTIFVCSGGIWVGIG